MPVRASTATLRALRASLPTRIPNLRLRSARPLTPVHSFRHLSAAAQAPCPNCHCGADADTTALPSTSSLTPQPQHQRATDDRLEDEEEEEQLTVGQRCDPYEQKGRPLTTETVQQLLSTLQPGWSYDAETKTLSKTFSFRSSASSSASPASLQSVFAFVSRVGHLCVNAGHSPQQLTVLPRRQRVTVQLRTAALKGSSYADFALAMHLDAAEAALRAGQNV